MVTAGDLEVASSRRIRVLRESKERNKKCENFSFECPRLGLTRPDFRESHAIWGKLGGDTALLNVHFEGETR
jgi:hypothetical protein